MFCFKREAFQKPLSSVGPHPPPRMGVLGTQKLPQSRIPQSSHNSPPNTAYRGLRAFIQKGTVLA